MVEAVESSAKLLAVDRVRVEFGSLVAVRDAAFELNGGELLGLIGPNGAGKTTLLRAIAGLQPLAAGQVLILGERVGPRAIHLGRHIGFTPDTPPVYEALTVREFLQFIAMGYGMGAEDVESRINFWLEQVWLADKAGQKIKALSRGMRQRVGIARTLLPNPNVILLDEPAAGLDPAGRVQFRQLLCNLRDQGKAIIVSSHILADMDEYCTHIAIMSRGSIVRMGTVSQVAAASEEGRCRYALGLARPVVQLAELLGAIEGVSGVQVDRVRATLEYSSQAEDAARLLAELVARRVPVASFGPLRPDLEEAYLRTGIEQVD